MTVSDRLFYVDPIEGDDTNDGLSLSQPIRNYAGRDIGSGDTVLFKRGCVSPDRQWLHFAFDDNRHRAVHFGAKRPSRPRGLAREASIPGTEG